MEQPWIKMGVAHLQLGYPTPVYEYGEITLCFVHHACLKSLDSYLLFNSARAHDVRTQFSSNISLLLHVWLNSIDQLSSQNCCFVNNFHLSPSSKFFYLVDLTLCHAALYRKFFQNNEIAVSPPPPEFGLPSPFSPIR